MGRKCGDIALYAGLCGGAEVILVPEVKSDISQVARSIAINKRKGKSSDIIVLAEGFCRAGDLKEQLRANGINSSIKTTELGYIQRGGAPTMQDRVLAAQFGVRAVDVLIEGKGSRVVGIRNNAIIDMDTTEALAIPRKFNRDLYNCANILGQ